MIESITLDAQQIAVDQDCIIKALGYPENAAVPSRVHEQLPALIEQIRSLAEIRAVARFENKARITKKRLRLHHGPDFHSPALCRVVAPAERLALFAITLGRPISAWLTALAAADLAASFIADAAASELIIAAGHPLAKELLARQLPEPLHSTLLYSPGYCDWPIEEMPALLERVEAERIGIALTAGGMMEPRKSVCGLVGFSTDPHAVRTIPCDDCRKDCVFRRTAQTAW